MEYPYKQHTVYDYELCEGSEPTPSGRKEVLDMGRLQGDMDWRLGHLCSLPRSWKKRRGL